MATFQQIGKHHFNLDQVERVEERDSPDGVPWVQVFFAAGQALDFTGDDATQLLATIAPESEHVEKYAKVKEARAKVKAAKEAEMKEAEAKSKALAEASAEPPDHAKAHAHSHTEAHGHAHAKAK